MKFPFFGNHWLPWVSDHSPARSRGKIKKGRKKTEGGAPTQKEKTGTETASRRRQVDQNKRESRSTSVPFPTSALSAATNWLQVVTTMKGIVFLLVSILALFQTAKASEASAHSSGEEPEVQGVIQLNARNFDSSIKDGSVWLIEFYSPWCG